VRRFDKIAVSSLTQQRLQDQRVKDLHRELQVVKMTSTFVMAFSMIAVFSTMSNM